jgi:hypothetical protein
MAKKNQERHDARVKQEWHNILDEHGFKVLEEGQVSVHRTGADVRFWIIREGDGTGFWWLIDELFIRCRNTAP